MGTAKEDQQALLVALYRATKGKMHNHSAQYEALGASIGLDAGRSREMASRLQREGLAAPLGIGSIALTPQGKEVAEETALTPQEREANEATARRVLDTLYRTVNKSTRASVDFVQVAAAAGVERDAAVILYDDFRARDWIESRGTGRTVCLTDEGVDAAEEG